MSTDLLVVSRPFKVPSLPQASKYIYFTFDRTSDTGKTAIFLVHSRMGNYKLGEIKWFGQWRCYSFFPTKETVFEKTCLRDIAYFCDQLMEHKKLRNKQLKSELE